MAEIPESSTDNIIPYILSIQTAFAALQLLNYLGPSYLIQSNRFWENTSFNFGLPMFWPLLALTTATFLWIISKKPLAIMPPWLTLFSFFFFDRATALAVVSVTSVVISLILRKRIQNYTIGLIAILGAIEAQSLAHWLILAPLGIQNPLQKITELEVNLYYLVAQFSPFIVLLFAVTGIVIPLYYLSKRPRNDTQQPTKTPLSRQELILLGLTLVLSVSVAIYPYLPNINPNQVNPGVDITSYLEEYQKITVDLYQVFTVGDGSRPVYYLLLFMFERAASLDPLNAIRFLPLLLNPLIIASTFFLAREATLDNRTALYSAFFTAAGITLSVGMYAYFLTDMLMLSIIFLSLGLLFRALRKKNRKDLILATALGSLFVFTHPWTFDQYLAAIGLTTAVTIILYIKKPSETTNPKWLITYLLIVGSTDIAKMLLLRGSVEGIAAFSVLTTGITSPQNFWLDLAISSRFYVGGYLTSIPLLGLATLGILKTRTRTTSDTLLQSLMLLTSTIYLIGDTVIKSRLIYNIPLGILAAIGLNYVKESNMDENLKKMLIATIMITLLAYLFRDLANLI